VPGSQRQHRNTHGNQDIRQFLPPIEAHTNGQYGTNREAEALQPIDGDGMKPKGAHTADPAGQLTQDQQAQQ
jgi:hypothetical protein